jgi:hypothetical protein
VRVHRNPENLGFSRNFARALSLCQGDILLISDQDDVWYPEKLEWVEAAFLARPDMPALVHDEHLANADGDTLPGTFLGNVRAVGYPDRYFVAGNCTALKRELLPLLLPIPPETNYDGWIATITDLLAARQILEVPLQLYRRHGGNSTEPELAREAPSLWGVAARFGLSDARPGWAAEIALLDEARRRVVANRPLVESLIGAERAAAALDRIDAERSRLETRSELLAKPRWRRGPSVMRLWAGGFYRDFSGGKSALKDLLRR